MQEDRMIRGQWRCSQDGFTARISPVESPPEPVASSPALSLAQNEDGSWTLLRFLDQEADDAHLQAMAGGRAVTAIGRKAFENCRRLRRVILPEGLREIAEMAFSGCSRLEEITIPGSVLRVGTLAFARCASLCHVRLGPGVQGLGPSAFSKCAALRRVDLPSSVAAFGGGVFFGCGPNLVLHGAADSPGARYAAENGIAFDAESWREDPLLRLCELVDGCLMVEGLRGPAEAVEIPEELCGRRVEAIAPKAFFGEASLRRIEIGAGVRYIGESAFMGCRALEQVSFSPGLEEIASSAFAGCERLARVELPHSVERVGSMVFFGCTSLGFAKLPNDALIGPLAFDACSPALRRFGGIHERR